MEKTDGIPQFPQYEHFLKEASVPKKGEMSGATLPIKMISFVLVQLLSACT